MRCPKCNNEFSDMNVRFCPYCGYLIQSAQTNSFTNNSNTNSANNSWYSNQQTMYSAPQNNGTNGELIVKIGGSILAVIYFFAGLVTLFSAIGNFFDMFSWVFSIFALINIVFSVVNSVLQLGMAVVLVLIAFTDKRYQIRELFSSLTAVGAGIVAINALSGLITLIQLLSLGRGASAIGIFFSIILKSLFLTLLALGIVYGLLYFSKEAPSIDYYKSIPDFGNYMKACMDIILTSIQNIFQRIQSFFQQKKSNPNVTNYSNTPNYSSAPNYSNTPNYPVVQGYPGAQAFPLKTDRSLLMYILLGVVTCGIYVYIFMYQLINDINIACDGDGTQTPGLVKFIVLSILTCGIYGWIWWYSLANRLAANAPRYGMHFQENGTTFLMWQLFGSLLCGIGPFIAMNIIIKNTNSICMAYNRHNGLM